VGAGTDIRAADGANSSAGLLNCTLQIRQRACRRVISPNFHEPEVSRSSCRRVRLFGNPKGNRPVERTCVPRPVILPSCHPACGACFSPPGA